MFLNVMFFLHAMSEPFCKTYESVPVVYVVQYFYFAEPAAFYEPGHFLGHCLIDFEIAPAASLQEFFRPFRKRPVEWSLSGTNRAEAGSYSSTFAFMNSFSLSRT